MANGGYSDSGLTGFESSRQLLHGGKFTRINCVVDAPLGKPLCKTILSTADVARLFNVTETTVKRWADDGTMKCQKTPGGHRKFLMKHVAEFASRHNYEPVGTLALAERAGTASNVEMAVASRDYDVLRDFFVEQAFSSDSSDLFRYFSYLYQHHLQLWEIYDHVLAPGMSAIGERWMHGDIGINHEHRASYQVLDALAKLQTQVLIRESTGLSVLCACLEDELHEIGLRCAAYLFESEGWCVQYLGARTPHTALVAAINELHPAVVCVSATCGADDDALRTALIEVARAARCCNAGMVLGGQGVSVQLAQTLGCNILQPTFRELLRFIREFPRPATGNGTTYPA